MFGINEVLSNKKNLTKKEKFKILHSQKIDPKIIEYLTNRLSDLYIEVLGDYQGTMLELMPAGKLEGWCWQTTESAIVFFNDDDYVERGNLKFEEKTKKYYHSWICFNFNGVEYVLDPCLNFLCKKDDYHKIFDVEVKGTVTAKMVREELIRQIQTPKEEDNSEFYKNFKNFWNNLFGDEYQERKKGEVIVNGKEDVNTPLYRNGAGYKTELHDGKIKKLTVHYYYTDC